MYLHYTNSGAPVQLQFHRIISECFVSNFVLFLNERDGLNKWART